MFCCYILCATFFNKCCCNAVLQVDLFLKICSTRRTDIFLKFSSSKFPEPSSFFHPSHSAKETTLSISSTLPDTNTITATTATTVPAKILPKELPLPRKPGIAEALLVLFYKKKKRGSFFESVSNLLGK